jgi:hypothetical protein
MNDDTITITKTQLQTALQNWEQDARDGKTMTPDEAGALTVEEHAAAGAYHLWLALGGVQP